MSSKSNKDSAQLHRGPQYVTRSEALEIAESTARSAVREQARALETHLGNIHERLQALERRVK